MRGGWWTGLERRLLPTAGSPPRGAVRGPPSLTRPRSPRSWREVPGPGARGRPAPAPPDAGKASLQPSHCCPWTGAPPTLRPRVRGMFSAPPGGGPQGPWGDSPALKAFGRRDPLSAWALPQCGISVVCQTPWGTQAPACWALHPCLLPWAGAPSPGKVAETWHRPALLGQGLSCWGCGPVAGGAEGPVDCRQPGWPERRVQRLRSLCGFLGRLLRIE